MTKAPERIYAERQPFLAFLNAAEGIWLEWQFDGATEYVRADLFAAQAAEIERLRAALAHTAEQALAAEIPRGYGPENKALWTLGYDAAIRHARKALEAKR